MTNGFGSRFRERFSTVAEEELSLSDPPWLSSAASRLGEVLDRGAEILESGERAGEKFAARELRGHDDSLRSIIRTATEIARSEGFGDVNDIAVQAALESLCPLWPFC